MSFRTLTRSRSDRMISGVCGGIAQTYRFDAVVVRGVFIVFGLVNIGIAAIVYVAAIFLLPEEISPLSPGTHRPGWRFDPWTGESLGHTPTEVVVDSAPPVASNDTPPDPSVTKAQPPTIQREQERPTDDEV